VWRPLTLRGRLRGALLSEDFRPVEFDVGVALLDGLDRDLVEGGASNSDARWGPKPIEDASSRSASPAIVLNDERVFVTALVAAEPQVGQDYFLFCARVAAFAAGRDWREPRAPAFRLGAGAAFRAPAGVRFEAAARDCVAGRLTAARRGAAGAGAGRLTSGAFL
jgi:hypothetical protein